MSDKAIEGGIKLNPINKGIYSSAVSVIIATYNAGETLQRCLDSIYKQKFQDVEIIIMDGRSTDDTVDILIQNSSKIYYWRSEKDDGIYYALNKALDYITGNWVIFLGADDELLPGFSDMVKELIEPSSIYYGSVLYKEDKCGGYISPYKMAKIGMQHQAMFYSASIFKKYKYDPKYSISADSVLNMTCRGDKSIKFIFKDYIVSRFNHTGISARQTDALLKKNMSRLVLKHFGFVIWVRYMVRIFKKRFLNRKLIIY